MPNATLLLPAAVLAATFLCGAASAGSLTCRSVNGNVSCVGSGGTSCQTVDGKTVCVGGNGDAVQTFGGGHPPPDLPDLGEDDGTADDGPVVLVTPGSRLRVGRGGPGVGQLQLRREGRTLHLRSDGLSVDIE
jgi:hypothetical protein